MPSIFQQMITTCYDYYYYYYRYSIGANIRGFYLIFLEMIFKLHLPWHFAQWHERNVEKNQLNVSILSFLIPFVFSFARNARFVLAAIAKSKFFSENRIVFQKKKYGPIIKRACKWGKVKIDGSTQTNNLLRVRVSSENNKKLFTYLSLRRERNCVF